MNETQLVQQFDKYVSLLKRFFDESCVDAFVENYGERLVLCPAGLTVGDGGHPGALVDRCIRMAQTVKRIVQGAELPVNVASAIRVALVAELGFLGDPGEGNELYVPQESDWHREKLGQRYKYNEACSRVSPSHRTLFLLQSYGMQLGLEELVAVVTAGGLHLPENAFYGNKKNDLIDVIQLAKHVVTKVDHKEEASS
jgi:hypothetical protein